MGRLDPQSNLYKEIDEIRRAGDRAAALTRQLLAFSRKQILQPKTLNLNQLISEIENMLKRLIGEDISLEMILEPMLHSIKADPGQVEQIILNLAVNARDAMPGGGRLILETSNVVLDETYTRRHEGIMPGAFVMMAVSDTGIGMDESTLEHLFEPFFTTKELGKGTGLGLSTIYGIVKQSGGSIYVYSEVGRGTTFKIYFPIVESVPSRRAPASREDQPITTPRTVLVVEDEEMVRQVICQTLTFHGYQVFSAPTGEEALELCRQVQEPIHLLLTDMVMPQMNGIDLSRRVREIIPNIKTVFMSGYTDNVLAQQKLSEEIMPFLQKPFSSKVLLQKLQDVLHTSD